MVCRSISRLRRDCLSFARWPEKAPVQALTAPTLVPENRHYHCRLLLAYLLTFYTDLHIVYSEILYRLYIESLVYCRLRLHRSPSVVVSNPRPRLRLQKLRTKSSRFRTHRWYHDPPQSDVTLPGTTTIRTTACRLTVLPQGDETTHQACQRTNRPGTVNYSALTSSLQVGFAAKRRR